MNSNDAWRVEAKMASETEEGVVVEMRLHSDWLGELPPFTIRLDAEPAMTDLDYEAQALILLAGSAAEMEGACIRESVRKGR